MAKLRPDIRYEIYDAIDEERDYQEGWNDPSLTDTGGLHSLMEFLAYIQTYTNKAIVEGSLRPDPKINAELKHALRKVAALAVSGLEQHGYERRDPADVLKQRHQ